MIIKKRFWVSWIESIENGDYRPIKRPLPKGLEYWCTGEDFWGTYVILCALIDVKEESNVKKIISKYWKPKEWRFIEEKAIDWIPPSDRFPLSVKNIKEI